MSVPPTSAAGRLTIRLFCPMTRRCSSRPNCGEYTPRTPSVSARRSVSDVMPPVAHSQLHPRDAGEHRPLGRDVRLDVVREHVVIDQVVLAVESPALGELLLRRVHRDVLAALAIEERDVLGLAARSRVGERAELLRAHLGDEVADRRRERPAVAAQVAEVELQRAADVLVEDRRGAPQVLRRHSRRLSAAVEHERELRRGDADERRIEVLRERVAAAEDAHLCLLGGVVRRELASAPCRAARPRSGRRACRPQTRCPTTSEASGRARAPSGCARRTVCRHRARADRAR